MLKMSLLTWAVINGDGALWVFANLGPILWITKLQQKLFDLAVSQQGVHL